MYRCLFLTVAVCLIDVNFSRAEEAKKPNVVVIIADDLGYGETGMQGNEQIPTPGIDALAASGVRCTCGYVTSSVCSPSRAGIMTGKFQSRFGYDINPTGERNLLDAAGLPETEPTFIEALQTTGYKTGLVGKWHLGSSTTRRPLQRGFDFFYGFLHEGHYFVPGPPYENVQTMIRTRSLPEGAFEQQGNFFRGNYTGTDEPSYDKDNPIFLQDKTIKESSYLTDAITSHAVKFIEESGESPFALIVAYNAVHSPMQGLNSDIETLRGIDDPQRKIFAAMLVALDRGVASIVDALDKRDLDKETLVVFLSDNGGPTRELTSSNAPLRGGKGDLYEGGIRVPMIWSMPGTLPSGAVEERAVLSLDIAATAYVLAGIAAKGPLDGVNVIPYLTKKNRGTIHERVYWRMTNGKTALRDGDWKIVRTGRQKAFELYHLTVDQAEKNDLANDEPTQLKRLVHAWMSMDSEMVESIKLE